MREMTYNLTKKWYGLRPNTVSGKFFFSILRWSTKQSAMPSSHRRKKRRTTKEREHLHTEPARQLCRGVEPRLAYRKRQKPVLPRKATGKKIDRKRQSSATNEGDHYGKEEEKRRLKSKNHVRKCLKNHANKNMLQKTIKQEKPQAQGRNKTQKKPSTANQVQKEKPKQYSVQPTKATKHLEGKNKRPVGHVTKDTISTPLMKEKMVTTSRVKMLKKQGQGKPEASLQTSNKAVSTGRLGAKTKSLR